MYKRRISDSKKIRKLHNKQNCKLSLGYDFMEKCKYLLNCKLENWNQGNGGFLNASNQNYREVVNPYTLIILTFCGAKRAYHVTPARGQFCLCSFTSTHWPGTYVAQKPRVSYGFYGIVQIFIKILYYNDLYPTHL